MAEASFGTQPWVCTNFDARGRPTSVAYPAYGGAPARTVTYNYSNPLSTTATDPAGTVTTKIDLLGRTVEYIDALGNNTSSVYDLAGRRTSSAMAGATVSFTYQPDGLLDTESVNGKLVADTTYDAADAKLTSVSYPSGANALGNGTTGTFTYDALMRPATVTWRKGTAPIGQENVRRTLAGNLTTRGTDPEFAPTGHIETFTYDGAGRLTGDKRQGTSLPSKTTQYTFSFADTAPCGTATGAGKNSNRTSKTIGTTTYDYCYDNADRLTSTTDPAIGAITYDSHGNTTTIAGETHTYDIADRHLATTKGATNVTYTRDLTGRIIARAVNGAVVERYGSGGGGDSPSTTTDAATGAVDWNLSLPGGALYTYRPAAPATSVWTYTRLDGAALAMANNVGTKIGATMHWDPDGNNILGGIPDNQIGSFDYGWHGGQQRPLEHEATLLPMIEMGARQYSPALGRFLEVDPIEGGTANDYAYVSDPVNLSDLDGNGCGFLWLRKCAKKDRYDRLTNSQLVALYRSMGHYLPAGYKFRGQIRKDFIKALRVSHVAIAVVKAGASPPSGYKGVILDAAKGMWAYYKPGTVKANLIAAGQNDANQVNNRLALCPHLSESEKANLSGFCN